LRIPTRCEGWLGLGLWLGLAWACRAVLLAPILSTACLPPSQVEFVVAFLGTTLARAVAAPLNQNYKTVREGMPLFLEARLRRPARPCCCGASSAGARCSSARLGSSLLDTGRPTLTDRPAPSTTAHHPAPSGGVPLLHGGRSVEAAGGRIWRQRGRRGRRRRARHRTGSHQCRR
jgi:hypothetical protein